MYVLHSMCRPHNCPLISFHVRVVQWNEHVGWWYLLARTRRYFSHFFLSCKRFFHCLSHSEPLFSFCLTIRNMCPFFVAHQPNMSYRNATCHTSSIGIELFRAQFFFRFVYILFIYCCYCTHNQQCAYCTVIDILSMMWRIKTQSNGITCVGILCCVFRSGSRMEAEV